METPSRGGRTGPQSLVIRPAEPADVETIWRLIRELASYEKLEHLVSGSPQRLAAHLFGGAWPGIDCVLAEADREPAGYALYYGVFSSFWTGPMLWLEDLYVTESRRGQGIGAALMRDVARVAVARGCVRVDWAVLDWNQASIDFYERLGATRHGGWHTYRLSGDRLQKLARGGET